MLAGRALLRDELITERDQLLVRTELEDGPDALATLFFELLERIEVPGIDDERLVTDDVGLHAKSEAAVRVVEVVR